MPQKLIRLTFVFLMTIGCVTCVSAAEPAVEVTPEKLDQLIADLDANEFAVRERASKSLVKIGLPAIDRVMQAATSKSLEQAHRSLGVLEQLLDKEETVSDAAEQALSQIARQQNTWSAQRADLALQQTRLLKQHKCLDKIKALGAEVVDEGVDENGELSYLSMIIKQENWKGTDKDLRLLCSLPSLRSLSVFGPVFNETQLTTLGELKDLASLNLYATKLSNDGLAKLQTAMPYTRIDRRNGGMLGISGDQIGGNGCMVNSVQPDSAAAAAGIEAEDVVVSIDGNAVESFSDLTKMISEKSGGDVVKLKIKRGEQTLDKEAKLGEWKPEHIKNGFRGGGNTIILQNGQRIIMAK